MGVAFAVLLNDLLAQAEARLESGSDRVLDSLPVMLAKGSRSSSARVAREIANKGYCASKKLYYRGLKLHLLAGKRPGRLPVPESLVLTKAAVHDLAAFQH